MCAIFIYTSASPSEICSLLKLRLRFKNVSMLACSYIPYFHKVIYVWHCIVLTYDVSSAFDDFVSFGVHVIYWSFISVLSWSSAFSCKTVPESSLWQTFVTWPNPSHIDFFIDNWGEKPRGGRRENWSTNERLSASKVRRHFIAPPFRTWSK